MWDRIATRFPVSANGRRLVGLMTAGAGAGYGVTWLLVGRIVTSREQAELMPGWAWGLLFFVCGVWLLATSSNGKRFGIWGRMGAVLSLVVYMWFVVLAIFGGGWSSVGFFVPLCYLLFAEAVFIPHYGGQV